MSALTLILIGVSLSMDAFAASVLCGVAYCGDRKQIFITALTFGFFQALMPVIGFLLGSSVSSIIATYDHWVAFVLLTFIGGKMIYDGIGDLCCSELPEKKALTVKTLLGQAIATSIDALAVGISFAALEVNILTAAIVIGCTTFLLCVVGGTAGQKAGCFLRRYAVLLGGIILVLLGTKILLEHLSA